jgi:hypothetical protein
MQNLEQLYSGAGGGGKGYLGVKRIKVHYVYTQEYNIMKPTKRCLKTEKGRRRERKYNGQGELVQGLLYVSSELSQ